MSDIPDYEQTYERGQALADLCRSYEIGAELLAEGGTLDGLLARVLEDCDRRLGELPEPIFESEFSTAGTADRERELRRVRSLLVFAKEAAGLRESGDTVFEMVQQVDDLERLKQQGSPEAALESVRTTDRALDLCSDVARLCHKINNPLTSLLGRAQMLQFKPDPAPEQLFKTIEVIEESARRVASVVQELAQVVGRGKEDLLAR